MKKSAAFLCLVLSLSLMGCSGKDQPQAGTAASDVSGGQTVTDTQTQQEAIKAVYLKNDQGSLFIDLSQGSPFTGSLPQDITDGDGSAISSDDLNSGDVVEVYGNGIMLNSYPGQYPGITRIVRVEKENKDYVEKYGELLNQFFPEPDMSNPPELSLNYTQSDAVVTAVCDRFGYTWTYTGENGETEGIAVDSEHVLQSDGLVTFNLEGETVMTVVSAYEPERVTVTRWPQDARDGSKDVVPDGEKVDVESAREGLTFTAWPGYIYEVIGQWPEGEATYGFEAVEKSR